MLWDFITFRNFLDTFRLFECFFLPEYVFYFEASFLHNDSLFVVIVQFCLPPIPKAKFNNFHSMCLPLYF